MTYFLTGVVVTAMIVLMVPAIKGALAMRDTSMRNWRLARTILITEARLVWALVSLANALPEEQIQAASAFLLVFVLVSSLPLSFCSRAWVENGVSCVTAKQCSYTMVYATGVLLGS